MAAGGAQAGKLKGMGRLADPSPKDAGLSGSLLPIQHPRTLGGLVDCDRSLDPIRPRGFARLPPCPAAKGPGGRSPDFLGLAVTDRFPFVASAPLHRGSRRSRAGKPHTDGLPQLKAG